ncbi:MAG: hypothetical protein ACUVTP_11625 [Candidatus Fervidibacter sp.]|uniref:hypothetical protein n=1 Tax=Candidatus Fervidibacter sp. TaxID=3100871 RepID=UPI0040493B94
MHFALFHNLCPNCGGEISVDRLEKGLACEKCLPELKEVPSDPKSLCELSREKGKLQDYRWVVIFAIPKRRLRNFSTATLALNFGLSRGFGRDECS